MFKHILLPTDGSATSSGMLQACMRFAKESGARVSALHVIPEFHIFTYQAEMLEDTRQQYELASSQKAKEYLAEVAAAAQQNGVECSTHTLISDHPYQAIIKLAGEQGCDLIAMASHGRKGVQGILLGSETQKVLTHSTIPVLVYR
ncbi:MAG: universal stress protein [Burkholderiales bacterium]|nr:universal stress protein [Burkholderiales bacterium]